MNRALSIACPHTHKDHLEIIVLPGIRLKSLRLFLHRKTHPYLSDFALRTSFGLPVLRSSTAEGDDFGLRISLNARQPLFPDMIQQHRRLYVPQAVFRDVPVAALGHQRVHIRAGDALGFG